PGQLGARLLELIGDLRAFPDGVFEPRAQLFDPLADGLGGGPGLATRRPRPGRRLQALAQSGQTIAALDGARDLEHARRSRRRALRPARRSRLLRLGRARCDPLRGLDRRRLDRLEAELCGAVPILRRFRRQIRGFRLVSRRRSQLGQHAADLRLRLPCRHARVETVPHALFSLASTMATRVISVTSASTSCAPLQPGAYAEMGSPSLEACANWVHWRTTVLARNSG